MSGIDWSPDFKSDGPIFIPGKHPPPKVEITEKVEWVDPIYTMRREELLGHLRYGERQARLAEAAAILKELETRQSGSRGPSDDTFWEWLRARVADLQVKPEGESGTNTGPGSAHSPARPD